MTGRRAGLKLGLSHAECGRQMPAPRSIGLAATALALALPAGAQAAPLARVADDEVVVRAGATAQITLRVEAVETCTLRIRRRVATVDAEGAAGVTFRFRIARRTRARFARATISCAPAAPQTVTFRVSRARLRGRTTRRLVAGRIEGVASLAAPPALEAPAPQAPGRPLSPEEAAAVAEAQTLWVEQAGEHDELWRSGECTDWADRKRPDVVERVTVAKWAAQLLGRLAPAVRWSGGHWDETAAAYGLPTGTTPQAGALVTWDPGVGGSGSVGHIAYVESVGDDSFVVSEMHAPDLGVVTERRVPIATIADGGVAFIY